MESKTKVRFIRTTIFSILFVLCFVIWGSSWDYASKEKNVSNIIKISNILEVEIIPDEMAPLSFKKSGDMYWKYIGDAKKLIGRSYSIKLKNNSHGDIKVVVGIDGMNVYKKKPIVHRSNGDTGSIIRARGVRTLKGWQITNTKAQRFVFSPSDWSEGAGTRETSIGKIRIDVYKKYRRKYYRSSRRTKDGRKILSRSQPSPPVGTTSGKDISSEVTTVRFTTSTREPLYKALIVYGKKIQNEPDILGIIADESEHGIKVIQVFANTPADDAGIREGDIIERIGNDRNPSLWQYKKIINRKTKGDYVFLYIKRGNHTLNIKLSL